MPHTRPCDDRNRHQIYNMDGEDEIEVGCENTSKARPAKNWEYGSFPRETDAVQQSVGKAGAAIVHRRINEFIPEENTRRFNHGTMWSTPAEPERGNDEMVTIGHESLIKWDDIVDQNLSIIPTSIMAIGADMAEQQVKMMFRSVSAACDQSGNVVNAGKRPLADAFVEMLEKIEFGVDRNGEVSMPSLYVPPDTGDRMIGELEDQPEEYQERIKGIIEAKKAAALNAEQARLDRFKRPPE